MDCEEWDMPENNGIDPDADSDHGEHDPLTRLILEEEGDVESYFTYEEHGRDDDLDLDDYDAQQECWFDHDEALCELDAHDEHDELKDWIDALELKLDIPKPYVKSMWDDGLPTAHQKPAHLRSYRRTGKREKANRQTCHTRVTRVNGMRSHKPGRPYVQKGDDFGLIQRFTVDGSAIVRSESVKRTPYEVVYPDRVSRYYI